MARLPFITGIKATARNALLWKSSFIGPGKIKEAVIRKRRKHRSVRQAHAQPRRTQRDSSSMVTCVCAVGPPAVLVSLPADRGCLGYDDRPRWPITPTLGAYPLTLHSSWRFHPANILPTCHRRVSCLELRTILFSM
jgi:hypothetical protein